VPAKPRFATRAGNAAFVETDVTKEDSVRSAIQQTVSHFGKLDILYNCAGGSIVQDAPVTDVDMSVWQHTISLDLLGTFHCCRHGIPELTKSGGGAIVNMSSVAALRGFPAHVYVAAKGGIISLTRALAGGVCEEWDSRQRDLPGIGEDRPGACNASATRTIRIRDRRRRRRSRGNFGAIHFRSVSRKISPESHCSWPRTRRG